MKVSSGTMHLVLEQIKKDKKTSPSYPDHVCGQASIVGACAGGLLSTALKTKYSPPESEEDKKLLREQLKQDAVRTIAAAFRFLENL
jgi:hypothetical protein